MPRPADAGARRPSIPTALALALAATLVAGIRLTAPDPGGPEAATGDLIRYVTDLLVVSAVALAGGMAWDPVAPRAWHRFAVGGAGALAVAAMFADAARYPSLTTLGSLALLPFAAVVAGATLLMLIGARADRP